MVKNTVKGFIKKRKFTKDSLIEVQLLDERKEEEVSLVERLWRSSLPTERVDWSRLDSET